MNTTHTAAENSQKHVTLVGGGIASLAAAVYLIHDAGVPGQNITILEEGNMLGGSLDGSKEEDLPTYFMRGYRMFEEQIYSCTYDLMEKIPSQHPDHNHVRSEFFSFNDTFETNAQARLVRKGEKLNHRSQGIPYMDRIRLFASMVRPDHHFDEVEIQHYFSKNFFESTFWYEMATTFSFQPWHSMAEFRRYTLRFIQQAPDIHTLKGIRSTPYNQYDSLVHPALLWLQEQGVRFEHQCTVHNIEFSGEHPHRKAEKIHLHRNGVEEYIILDDHSYVFLTLGSMTDNSSTGSMTSPPPPYSKNHGSSWKLWKTISAHYDDFGNPDAFCSDTDKSSWASFTMTLHDPRFIEIIKNLSGQEIGSEGLITFPESHWLLTIALPPHPHFVDQPEHVNLCWGYGLSPHAEGNFVQKKMSECSGEEILAELLGHLDAVEHHEHLLQNSVCIPVMMPYITSQFMPRAQRDRPKVVPQGSKNFAFLGQFIDIPGEITFTVEQSIRSAQTAVYELFNVEKEVTPLYKGYKNPLHVLRAIGVACR